MTQPLEWPKKFGQLRNNLAELLREDDQRLSLITGNEVNDEEQIEAIVDSVRKDLIVAYRALEKAGALTDPIQELENRTLDIKHQSFAKLRATPA